MIAILLDNLERQSAVSFGIVDMVDYEDRNGIAQNANIKGKCASTTELVISLLILQSSLILLIN